MKSFLSNNSAVFHKGLITLGLMFFALGVHNALAAVVYDSVTYHSIGYGASNNWNAVGGTALVAANDHDGDDSYITVNTKGKAETFEFPTMHIPTGSTIDSVSLYMFAKKVDVSDDGITSSHDDPKITFRVENGANPTHVSDAGTVTVSNDGTYKIYARHMGTNPITGDEWTLHDFISGKLRYGIVRANEGTETGIEPWVTAVWVDVNYATNGTSTDGGTGGGDGEGSGGTGGGTGGSGSTGGSTTTVNTAPIANPQSITTPVDTVATTTLTGTDTDVPAQTLTYAIATTTAHGTTTLIGNVITYTPEAGFVGTDSFTFTVSDGVATSTPATVTITVGTPSGNGGGTGGSGGGSSSGGSGSTGGSGGSGGGTSVSSGGGYFVNANGQPVSSGSGQTGQVLGASTTCELYITKYTRNGYANDVDTVKKVQTFLNSYLGASIPVTGFFGSMTEKYVRDLQVKHKDVILTPWNETESTGIAYLTTVTAINNIVCPELHLPIPTNLIPFSENPVTPEKI